MSFPKVSVVVPNYNHAPYLKQRLDSIFNQTFQNFEVIILDDCSTDNSKEIIEQYRNNPKVSHIVYNETNSGSPFKQWAKGFDLAQGEFIWIAESDDWAETTFLQTLTGYLNQNRSLALAFCASNWVYPSHTTGNSIYPNDNFLSGISFIKTRMLYNNSIHNASCVVFRKKNLQKISDFYQNYKSSGDYLFWISLCQTGNIQFVARYLNNFRKHDENTTTKNIANGQLFIENHHIFEYLRHEGFLSNLGSKSVALYWQKATKDATPNVKSIWEQELSHKYIYQTICFSCAIFTRLIPIKTIKNSILKDNPWLLYYNDFNLLELIWIAAHLPKTEFRKRFSICKKS